MANFELIFIDKYSSLDFIKAVKCDDDIIITLREAGFYRDIRLDKSTAIKFAKTLRTEINKITEIDNKISKV
jgi:hypothetical protein